MDSLNWAISEIDKVIPDAVSYDHNSFTQQKYIKFFSKTYDLDIKIFMINSYYEVSIFHKSFVVSYEGMIYEGTLVNDLRKAITTLIIGDDFELE
jgi:hypothetical protein